MISCTVVVSCVQRASVSRAVVRAGQVVVDRLRHAHGDQLVVHLAGEAAELRRRVHRVVPADVEEVADVVRPEDLEDPLVVGPAGVEVLQLVPATAEGAAGRALQPVDLGRVFLRQVVQVLLEHAEDAVQRPVDAGEDLRGRQGRLNHPAGAGVDHRRRPARLGDHGPSLQSAHALTPL
jgi:hypothetical protein